MISVLIVDDHAVIRQGIKDIISEEADIKVTGECATAQDMFHLIKSNDYDIVLLDINLPQMNGIDALKLLKNLKPNLPVLILSVYSEEHYAMRMLRAGASGYLSKDCSPDEIIAAIRKVAKGGSYITTYLAEKIVDIIHLKSIKEMPHASLSDREFQILCMIAKSKTPQQISDELSLSVKTISTYRARILKKLALKNSTEIMRYAMENHLIG
ncbi:MAG: response regulator transcription factor [Nitrospirae bacterium]|nr:response regulator transcription factor [Nitrospirota bacterium]